MGKLQDELHKENATRWVGKAEYSCLTCSHSMSTDDNELVCLAQSAHKFVSDDSLCKKWI